MPDILLAVTAVRMVHAVPALYTHGLVERELQRKQSFQEIIGAVK